MSDPEAIYLQPECCADPDTGRLWCEDDAPVDCEDGKPWTKYVRADMAEQQAAEIERLRALLNETLFYAPCRGPYGGALRERIGSVLAEQKEGPV